MVVAVAVLVPVRPVAVAVVVAYWLHPWQLLQVRFLLLSVLEVLLAARALAGTVLTPPLTP